MSGGGGKEHLAEAQRDRTADDADGDEQVATTDSRSPHATNGPSPSGVFTL